MVESSCVADQLSALYATEITPIDGGFRVKETETSWVDVLRMFYNWRVSRTPKARPWECDRGWCFYGNDFVTMLRAIGAALEWDGADGTSPEGWDKNAFTGEYAHPSRFADV